MKKYLKVTCLTASLVVGLVLLSGCSLMGPKDAQSAFEKYYKVAESLDNYHMDMDMDISMNMGFSDATVAEEMKSVLGTSSIDVPITLGMGLDVGKESAHGDMNLAMSFMGQSEKEKGEMYIDIKDGYTYTKMDSDETWSKSEYDDSALNRPISADDLKDVDWSKFKFEKTDNGYVASVAMEDVPSLMDGSDDYFGDIDLDDAEIEGGDVIFTFDKKCMLTKVEMKDVEMSGKSDMGDGYGDMIMTIDLDATMDLSKFNELKEEDYEIPSKVKKDAEDGESGLTIDPIFGGGDTPEDPVTPIEPTEPISGGDGSGTVLDGSKVPADESCYVVGKDIKPGLYNVYRTSKSGSGVMSISDAETFETNYSFSMGFGNDDDTPDGSSVVLETGDQIFITTDLILEFR